MLIALGQIKPAIGDLDGNVAMLRQWIAEARAAGAQVVLFPELALSGYPPEDLLLRSDFVERCGEAVNDVARAADGIVVAFGAPLHGARDLHNALVIAAGGEVRAVYHKIELPNYGTFDEGRYFGRGNGRALVRLGGHLVGLTICADLWIPDGPAAGAARAGAELILNASASTYHAGKAREREALLFQRARDMVCPIAYCNMWGGMDELVFDGGSMAVDHRGEVVAGGRQFQDELVLCSLDLRPVRAARLRDPRLRAVASADAADPSLQPDAAALADIELAARRPGVRSTPRAPVPGPEEEMWSALTLGIADHAGHLGLTDAVVGLDGGIDSAVVALLAADALGAARLTCVSMPANDSDPEAAAAASELAATLGCSLRIIDTEAVHTAYLELLGDELAAGDATWTAARIRARIRANVLMALADAHRWLHLSTGNKSELACGYSTLYGETFGGFAAIKDVPRTLVVRLAGWREQRDPGRPIPARTLALPHAGMHPSPWAIDGLPAFEEVDPILQAYVEDDEDPETIAARGHDPVLVRRIVALVEAAEPKRRQTPPGIKISTRAFERDRRMPLTHRFVNRPSAARSTPAVGVPAPGDLSRPALGAAGALSPGPGRQLQG